MLRRVALQCALAVLCVAAVAAASGNSFQRVQNKEFGLSAELPVGAVMCRERHGFSFLLTPHLKRCKSRAPQPYIAFFGDYNVLGYTAPRQSLSNLCPKKGVKVEGAVSDLSFPGRVSASCEQGEKHGWIDVFVQALGGKWPDEKSQSSGGAYIVYTAQLHTSRNRLEKDIVTFRRVLETAEIAPR